MPFKYLIMARDNNHNKPLPMQNNKLQSLSMSRGEFLKTTAAVAIVPEQMAVHRALAAKPGMETRAEVLSIVVEAH